MSKKEETIELTVAERIANIRVELRIGKEGEAVQPKFKYDYFRPDDINNALNPLLHKYNLLDHFHMTKERDIIHIEYTIFDAADINSSVAWKMDFNEATLLGGNPTQVSGATMTYAKRYCQMNAFNIAENDMDLDSNELQEKVSKQKKAEPITVDEAYSWIIENLGPQMNNRMQKDPDYDMAKARDKMTTALVEGTITKDRLLEIYQEWK